MQSAYERYGAAPGAARLDERIRLALRQLREQPRSGKFYAGRFRRLVVTRSPYGLFYVVENRGVVVHAFVDLRQNPDFIRRRLGL